MNIERRGDTYHFHWYAPNDSYVGNGILIGNIMVVGYALGRAPGAVGYCIRGGELDGLWTHGEDTRLGRELLHRQANSSVTGPDGAIGSECLSTIAMDWSPDTWN